MTSQASLPYFFVGQASSIRCASHFRQEIRYLRWTGLKYMSRLTFQMGKQVIATGQASSTRSGSYFRWENRYLQPDRSQVHAVPYILGGKTNNYNQRGLRYRFRLKFCMGKQVPTTVQGLRYTPRLIFQVENK